MQTQNLFQLSIKALLFSWLELINKQNSAVKYLLIYLILRIFSRSDGCISLLFFFHLLKLILGISAYFVIDHIPLLVCEQFNPLLPKVFRVSGKRMAKIEVFNRNCQYSRGDSDMLIQIRSNQVYFRQHMAHKN